jgi:hypothetical protein
MIGRAAGVVLGLSALVGCTESFEAPERAPDERAPLSGACDALDETRCLLPWPSSRFLAVDEETATGVRQHLDPSSYDAEDDAAPFEVADGFSRISPLVVGSSALLEPMGDDAVRVWVSDPTHPRDGEEIPLRVEVQTDPNTGESLVVAHPRRPMPENAAMVAVAMKADGFEPNAATLAALGLREPTSQEEADLRGYHAPTRAFLEAQGVDLERVARVWDFVTRSQAATLEPLLAMRERTIAAVDEGAGFAIDMVELAPKPDIAVIVEGSFHMPYFVTDALPDPELTTEHEARFRITIPEGTGDYPLVLFGHGMGGNYYDPAFDEALAAEGMGKVGVDFHGWTESTMLDTMSGFTEPIVGTAVAAGYLLQGLAELSAMQHALSGPLADLLAADEIGGVANPAAGRRPDMRVPIYGGGSMGGTMGYTYVNMEPSLHYAALNVGGGGWTHFLRHSSFFAPLDALMRIDVGSPLDVTLLVAQSQTNFDYADGAVWADHPEEPPVLLLQESVGDPVLPNIGTELMALASGAVRVGEAIDPFGDLEQVERAAETTAITQFAVTGDDAFVHGFAITDTVAGEAARDQIRHFMRTAQQGEAEIVVPAQCEAALCDFTE